MCPVYMDPKSFLEEKLNKIEDCLDMNDPKITTYQKNGWKLIIELMDEYCIYLMPDIYMHFLIKLSIKLAGIYYTQVRLLDSYFRRKIQLRNSKDTFMLYQMILSSTLINDREVGLDIIIEAFDEEHLWDYEQFCLKIINIYINASKRNYDVFFDILHIVDTYMDVTEMYSKTKALLNVLGKLFTKDKDWHKYEEELGLKILVLHIKAIESHAELRYAIEVAIRNFLILASNDMLLTVIENILDSYSNLSIEDLDLIKLEYSIKIATKRFVRDEILWACFNYDTIKNILTLISSPSKTKCIFGNQTFQNMLDSERNLVQFTSPKIFFNEIHYSLRISELNTENKEFLKRYRKEIHLTLLTAIKNHKDDIHIMSLIYTSIALIMVAIPSDFTAAMLVCLVMNLQKNTLAENVISGAETHRIHALVISIMSLVCWVTESKGLYAYLNKILTLRAYNAPFLNPPLKVSYTYCTHYVLWNKPEFFFEIFEVRYALWKRFRLEEKDISRPVPTNARRKSKPSKQRSRRTRASTLRSSRSIGRRKTVKPNMTTRTSTHPREQV